MATQITNAIELLRGELDAIEEIVTPVRELDQNGQIAVSSAYQNIEQARLLLLRSKIALEQFAAPSSVKPSEPSGKRRKQVGPQEAKDAD